MYISRSSTRLYVKIFFQTWTILIDFDWIPTRIDPGLMTVWNNSKIRWALSGSGLNDFNFNRMTLCCDGEEESNPNPNPKP